MRSIAPLLALTAICCGGAAGEAVRPKDVTATGALGVAPTSCSAPPKAFKPLVVDLDSDARVSLEAGMKKGVVVVAYDCTELRVLPNCHVPDGTYDYAGVQLKEQVVQIKGQDELNVNLPLSAGKLGGEIRSGRSIDLALVLVGQAATTVSSVDRTELTGSCEGATHFIQTAAVGAFAMATGSMGKVAMAADLFKVGASGKSDSSRAAVSNDGSLESCRASNPDGPAPPPGCRAPLRLELIPIQAAPPPAATSKRPKGGEKSPKKEVEAEENPCREGYDFVDGICTRNGGTAGHICDPKNATECKEQCAKNSAESCLNYARLSQLATMKDRDEKGYGNDKYRTLFAANVVPSLKKACDLGSGDGCAHLGLFVGGNGDVPTLEGLHLAEKACSMGSAKGCEYVVMWRDGDEASPHFDAAIALRAAERGCALGDPDACEEAAETYLAGKHGMAHVPARGVELLTRTCAGDSASACARLADILLTGEGGVPKAPEQAAHMAQVACRLEPSTCEAMATILRKLGRDEDAVAAVKLGCDAKDGESCDRLAHYTAIGKGTPKDPAKAKELYGLACKYDWQPSCKKAK